MNRTFRITANRACLILFTLGATISAADDVILKWNQVLSNVLKADLQFQNPGMASRSLAMTNLAMYDAINSIQPTFRTLQGFYGTDEISFGVRSEEVPGVTRTFNSFGKAMAENGRSRAYLGIHWDFDGLITRQRGSVVSSYVMLFSLHLSPAA